MIKGPDLVSLLYRADWTRLSLSADVHVRLDRDLVRSPLEDGATGPASWLAFGRPGGPWPGLASLAGGLGAFGAIGVPGGPSREPRHEWGEAPKVPGTRRRPATLPGAPVRRLLQHGGSSAR